MIEKITGIVLGTVRHNERTDIVALYTAERGYMPLLSPVGYTEGHKARRARLMPLCIIQADLQIVPSHSMQRLSSFSLLEHWGRMRSHPMKLLMTQFLAEFLGKLLRESPGDPKLLQCIVDRLRDLNNAEARIEDKHIAMLAALLPHMGIQPDLSAYAPDSFFDMRGGAYVALHPGHADILEGEHSQIPILWQEIAEGKLRQYPPGARRRIVFYALVRYYAIHFPDLLPLKTLMLQSDTPY